MSSTRRSPWTLAGLVAALALITWGVVALLDLQEAAQEERSRKRAESTRGGGEGASLRGSAPDSTETDGVASPGQRVLRASVVAKDTGLPMPGAQVELRWVKKGEIEEGRFVGWTGEAGTVTFRAIPAGDLHLTCLVAGQGWHARKEGEQEVEAPEHAHEFSVELVAVGGRMLTGVVRTEGGAPVPRQDVVARVGDNPHFDTIWGVTDEAGRFMLRGLPDSHFSIRTDHEWSEDAVPSAFTFVDADTERVELVLRAENGRDTTMVFRVRGPDGRAITNFYSRIWSAIEGRSLYLEEGLEVEASKGPAWLEVWGAQDDEENRLPASAGVFGPFTGPGPHVIKLEADVTLPGRITDAGGRPVAGATVVAAPVHAGDGWPPNHLRYDTAESDEDGVFTLHHLPNVRFRLHVSAPPGHAHPDPRTVAVSDRLVGVSLRPAPDVTVTVTDAKGAPLRGLTVRVLDPRIPRPIMMVDGVDPRTVVEDTTDDDGQVVVSSLPPDRRFELVVNSQWVRFRSTLSMEYWTHTDAEWSPADTLVRLVPVRTVTGTVRGDTPLAKDGISVAVTTHDGHEWHIDVDEDGEFVLEGVPAATLALSVGAGDGRWSKPVTVDADATTVVLDLPE